MGSTMLGLVKESREPGAVLKEVPVPEIGHDEVLVRVKVSSICGTDMHIYNWDAWAEQTVITPNVFGHEFAGIVEAIGNHVFNVAVGDYISAEGHIVCGWCSACRSGNAHVCRNTRSFGITAPGCFASYAVVKASNVIHNAANLPLELACLQDPLGNAVHAVMAGDIVGKSVAVIGSGLIGLMSIAVAKACGAGQVIAVDINPYRLEMARKMGADVIINNSIDRLSTALQEFTEGEGPEVILEMSGNPEALKEAIVGAAQAARVSLMGIPPSEVALDMSQIIFKGIRLEGITGRRMYKTWQQMKGLLHHHSLDISKLVTHTFTLERYEEAFELMQSGLCGKVLFLHEATSEYELGNLVRNEAYQEV
ncbi:L-threonine 3-dehydrogenase [Paenibacillus sp. JCM 10914]|uniref:L-threonine 3-dehydrogenase n=1 Tax=Paenibacillus sp. JCM 10914 TaxID=1236974 RepID=UPI0003CC5F23|nr:L-threonine 3-dehydrogenase [Paenibacillus sp. JCM 10914]GAE07331.1 L-threonine 3-dehydrogenase [Paenibacillus sp. JCM 10914]